MKYLLILLTFVTVAHLAMAAISLERISPTRGPPDRCIKSKKNVNLGIGQTQFKSDCSRVSCKTRRGELMLEIESCNLEIVKPGCRLVEDKSKTHPICCPKVVC